MPKLKLCPLTLVLSDLAALFTAGILAYALRSLFPNILNADLYLQICPLLLFFIPLYAALNLYPGITIPMPDVLKRMTTATSLGFLFFSAMLFISQRGEQYSRIILFSAWCLALFSVPFFRHLTQKLFSRFSWWGYPVVIFGHGAMAGAFYTHLRHNRDRGFMPLAVFTQKAMPPDGKINYLQLASSSRDVRKQMRPFKKEHPDLLAVIILDNAQTEAQQKLFQHVSNNFTRILLVPDETFTMRLSVRVAEFCGQLALSLRQNLLDKYKLQLKRLIDLLIALMLMPVLTPVLLLIYIIVRLDSPGPGLFKHTRLGYGGREIKIWKFRTMYKNASEMLGKILDENPEMRLEWEQDQKLKNDPRITKVGAFLRRYSLDELPQIINVFSGTMSLVGPRPIVTREIPRYGSAYVTYMRVKPGVTGLWQVSGRSDTSYTSRVSLDEYYIANWSVWLDIYILVRTLPAAIRGQGAY